MTVPPTRDKDGPDRVERGGGPRRERRGGPLNVPGVPGVKQVSPLGKPAEAGARVRIRVAPLSAVHPRFPMSEESSCVSKISFSVHFSSPGR